MSARAFLWADVQPTGCPLMKLMLLCLADWSDQSGFLRVRFNNLRSRCQMTHSDAVKAFDQLTLSGYVWVESFTTDPIEGVILDLHLSLPIDRPKGFKRRKLSPQRRAQIMQRDNGACRSCGSTTDVCIDHIVPLCQGGSNEVSNLQVLCRPCNSSKAWLSPEQWAEKRSRIKP